MASLQSLQEKPMLLVLNYALSLGIVLPNELAKTWVWKLVHKNHPK